MRGLAITFGTVALTVAALAAVDALPRHAGSDAAEPSPPARDQAAAAVPEGPRPVAEATGRPGGRVEAAECEPPMAVAPRDLAAAWPSMLGRRVSFAGRVTRTVALGEAVVRADGARFAVMMDPSDAWTGESVRTYRVIGSTAVGISGPTRLPQLLLEPACGHK